MKNVMSSTLLFSTLALLGIIAIIAVIHIDSAGKENSSSTLEVFKSNKDLQQQQQHRYLKQPVLVFEEEEGNGPCSNVRCGNPCLDIFCAGSCRACDNPNRQGCTATCYGTNGNKVCAAYECVGQMEVSATQ